MKNSIAARVCLAAVAALACLGMAGRAAVGADLWSANKEVKIDNFTFGPAEVTVPVGATVMWANRDDIPHTVVSTDKVFRSKVLDTDQRFSFTFSTPGTFSYYCSIHPKMTGKVVVQ